MLLNLLPLIRKGACPSSEEMFAPICVSGSMTRRIGRRESDASPIISLVNGWLATIADDMRIVETEFAQSRGDEGEVSAPPRPAIAISPLDFVTSTPSDLRHARVLAQSAPVEKLRRRVVPCASAASIA